ncbi:MAG: hypothetical protein HOO91_11380 [Bacteroidales bacterium]|nr:hypothetical protein [Bacteroidales bacterium]
MSNGFYNKNKTKVRKIIIVVFIIIIDHICSIFFIPESSFYNDFRVQHSYYHHSLLPNQSCRTNINVQNQLNAGILNLPFIAGEDYVVKTNSLGFIDHSERNIPLSTQKDRMLFIGGSYVEGYGCTFDSSFVGLLYNKYDQNQYEILNAGVIAYSPKLIYLKTKFLIEVTKLKFNKLIVFANTVEISDEIIYESFVPKISKNDADYNSRKNKAIKYLRKNSFLYFALSEIYRGRNFLKDPTKPSSTLPLCEDVWPTKQDYINQRLYWEDSVNYEKWGKKGFTLAQTNISSLFELCRNYNIEMIVVTHPLPEEVLEHHIECKYVQLWENYCKKYNAQFINLYPVFMNNSLSPEEVVNTYYIKGDGHWTHKGHKLVADYLYNNLNIN